MGRWLLVGILMSSVAFGQELRGKIVHFKSGVPNAIVVVNDSLHTTTGRLGEFYFPWVPTGTHLLRITHTQYQPLVITLELKGDTTLADIVLEESIYELQEVTVRENRWQQAQKQNALNVALANQEFLRRNFSGSLMQSLEQIPGVNAMTIGSGQSKPQIRGLGFNQVVVVDGGVKHEGQQWGADHGLEIDAFAAGSVEIVKGAASYLFGSDALGGIIRVQPHTPPPLHTMNLSITSSYMNNSHAFGNSVRINGRKHAWYGEVQATLRDYGDYRVPVSRLFVYDYEVLLPNGRVRNSAGNEHNLHATVGRITERLQTRFYVGNVSSKSGFFANAHGLEPRRVDEALHDASYRDIQLPRQHVNHFKVIHNSVLEWKGNETAWDVGYQRNVRAENSPYVNHGFMPPVFPLETDPTLERHYYKHVLSGNIRNKRALKAHELTWGGSYEYQKNSISGWGFLIPAFEQSQLGLFVYDRWRLSATTLLHAAVRWDYARMEVSEYKDWFASGSGSEAQQLIRARALKRSFDNLNGTLGGNHTWGKSELKWNVGTAFRMPLAKELAANGVNYHYFRFEKGNPDLSPEKSIQVDLGFFRKSSQLDLELTPFYSYFFNYIYLNPTAERDDLYGAGNQIFAYQESRVVRMGGEAVVRYRPISTWTVAVNAEYLFNRQLSGQKRGFTLPFSPPPAGTLSLTWQPAKHYATVKVKHALEQTRIVPPERTTGAYTVWGIAAGTHFFVKDNKWDLNLQVNNLFDTRYLNHTSFYRLIELPEMGRNVSLQLSIPLGFAI